MSNPKEGSRRSPTSVIAERLGKLGGYFFTCLNQNDHYDPSPDDNDLLFEVAIPPATAVDGDIDIPSFPEQEDGKAEKIVHGRSECPTRSIDSSGHQPYMTCDGCRERIYPTDGVTRAFSPTRIFHVACFKCSLCQGHLKHHGSEFCFQIPNDEFSTSLILLCVPCQQESLSKYTDKTEAAVAGRRIEPSNNEFGDVNGVLDDIGDDLERVMMDHYVPTCTICGGNFLSYNSNKVVLLGPNLKYHSECWETGKPSTEIQQRRLEPLQAIKYLPTEIIVKIKGDASVSTLYLVWKNRLDDLKRMLDPRVEDHDNRNLTVEYSVDQTVENFVESSVPWSPQSSLYTFEFVGEPLGKSSLSDCASTITMKDNSNSEASGTMELTRFQLKHVVTIDIPIAKEGNKGERLDIRNSSMAITLLYY
eukprot:scaffold6992_cov102-Cylindrotheca_fusiformis.AAC.10